MENWSHVPRGFSFPEPIQKPTLSLFWEAGTVRTMQPVGHVWETSPLYRLLRSVSLREIFDDELSAFERRYGSRLSLDEYQILNRLLPDLQPNTVNAFAKDVISLAERLITPTDVFVMMSFAEKGHLKDAYNTFQRVCKENGFLAFKVDHHIDPKQRIVPAIFSSIKRSAFIIADVTEPRPNVYYELGYAQALGKDVITTAFDDRNHHSISSMFRHYTGTVRIRWKKRFKRK